MSDDAAAQRADHVRALKEERVGYERAGDAAKVALVDAELARFEAAPKKRAAAKQAKAD